MHRIHTPAGPWVMLQDRGAVLRSAATGEVLHQDLRPLVQIVLEHLVAPAARVVDGIGTTDDGTARGMGSLA